MFGLACKGLHCAGCGKGRIVLVVIGILVAGLVVGETHRFLSVFHEVLIGAAITIGVATAGTTVSVIWLFNRPDMANCAKWDGPTITELKNAETLRWGERLSDADYKAIGITALSERGNDEYVDGS